MTETLPKHVRDNFDRTSISIHRLRGLLTAVDALSDQGGLGEHSPQTEAMVALIELARETDETVDHDHAMEWCGLGGVSPCLTAEQQAEARGQGGKA
jgi:hypothetical protein